MRAHARKLQKGNTWRLRRNYAPAEWGGYNERKRDRHALRCSHVTPPSPRLWRTRLPDVFLPSARCARSSDFATFGDDALVNPSALINYVTK